MDKKRLLKKLIFSVFLAAAYIPVSLATTGYLYKRKDPNIETHVQANLEQIIKDQEKELGITYPSDRPSIEYTLPQRYRVEGMLGLYDINNDTIYLPSGLLTKPKWDWSDFLVTMVAVATFNNTDDVKSVLDHELAHFYCDKMREKALGEDYSPLLYSFYREEGIAYKLINEGIAEYFSKRMNGEYEEPFSFQDWPSETYQFKNQDYYQGGYALVKPIIDKYGEKGIKFLLFNLPNPKELFKPREYQERILMSIAKL